MAARKTRLNFTLSPENVRAAQEIAEERGLKLSTFVDRAIAAYVKQLREPAKLAPNTPGAVPSIDYKRWESQITGLIPRAFETYLEGHYGDNDLKRLVEMWTAASERRATPAPTVPRLERPPLATATPKASKRGETALRAPTVDIPPEVVERIRKFKRAAVAEATGQHPGAITKILNGERTRLRKDGYDRLIAGLEKLESRE